MTRKPKTTSKTDAKTPAKRRDTSSRRGHAAGHVGSDPEAAAHFADKQDFGIPATEAGRRPEVADEAKFQPAGDHTIDPRPPLSDLSQSRVAGVGGNDSGAGSSSGGALDTDFVRIEAPAPDPETRHAAKDFKTPIRGSTVDRSGGDASTTGTGLGSSSVSPGFDTGDDASLGEISQGEAAGDDNSPSDNQ